MSGVAVAVAGLDAVVDGASGSNKKLWRWKWKRAERQQSHNASSPT